MNERISRLSRVEKISHTAEHSVGQYRRPFWMPAITYYALAAVASFVAFFFIWLILNEGNEESPIAFAVIGAFFLLGSSIVAREIFLRNARQRFMSVERKLDYTLSHLPAHAPPKREAKKLSLEKNAEIIKEIRKKSEAARTLGNLSNGHWNVIEICNEYLSVIEKQMETVGTGSPRLAGLRRGREIVGDIHRFHTLTWAEIESKSWSQKARSYATISEKLNAAQEALNVLDSALQFYPSEKRLTESEAAIKNFIATIKVSHWIEQAERAAFKGSYKRAVNLYRDALFFLARENIDTAEQQAVAEQINLEIEKLRNFSEQEIKQVKLKRGKNKKGNEYSEMSKM